MSGILVCLSAAVLGVDYGWQPVAGGGIEYIIQIEPELVESLKAGNDLFSDLPASVRNIRSYRITVGTGRLPHHGEPPPASAVVPAGGSSPADEESEASAPPTADVDLSQLPGPVLGPAFLLQPGNGQPANDDNQEEPPFLADADAAPLDNRVAGYHGKQKPPLTRGEDDESVDADKSPPSQKPLADQSEESHDGAAQATAKVADADVGETESPSDQPPQQPQTPAVRPALVQLGLLASLGGNVFLVWIATGQRSRYRALVRRMFANPPSGPAPPALMAPDSGQPRWERLPDDASRGTT
ncbi:MAG TPA: hypothetical protein VFI31_08465 [Pirellulales bacterium]|nr:hypothetical protein [Pirellulales bacterium]